MGWWCNRLGSEDIKKYGYYYASLKTITIETYDKYIPKNITTKDGTGKPEDFHAFLYNSTKGGEGSVYLTAKENLGWEVQMPLGLTSK